MLKICKILSLNTALLFIGNVLLLYTVLTDTCIPQRRLLRDAMKAKCAVPASALTGWNRTRACWWGCITKCCYERTHPEKHLSSWLLLFPGIWHCFNNISMFSCTEFSNITWEFIGKGIWGRWGDNNFKSMTEKKTQNQPILGEKQPQTKQSTASILSLLSHQRPLPISLPLHHCSNVSSTP